MATTHIKQSTSASRLINYAEKRAELKEGINCDIDYAKSDFKRVREIYGNKGSIEAYASRVAFSPEEFNPKDRADQEKALQIAKEIYQEAYPNHQVALYVHTDTQSLHVHAVIGAINLETEKKWHGNWQEYHEKLVKITDKVVKEHGLSVTVPYSKAERYSMAEIKMKQRGQIPWKDKIRSAIDSTMREAHISDFESFKGLLREKAVEVVERGRGLTYGLLGTNYKARGSKLGQDYKKETIFNELDRRKTNITRKSVTKQFDFGEFRTTVNAGRSQINNERAELSHNGAKKQASQLSRDRENARKLARERAKAQEKRTDLLRNKGGLSR